MYGALADAVMAVHVLLILLVFAGIVIALEWRRFRPVEAVLLISALLIWSLYGGCPLTGLESHFRSMAGTPIPLQEVGFIAFYVREWFGVAVSDATITKATYAIAILFVLLSFEWIHTPVQRYWKRIPGRKARRTNDKPKRRGTG